MTYVFEMNLVFDGKKHV